MFHRFRAIALGAFVCVRPPVAAAKFTAGAAAVDITPEAGAIHWFNDQPYDGVVDRLHARALVLGSGDTRVGILTLDIAEINEDDLGAIRRAVAGATAIPAGHILVNSSLTHSAPTSPGFKWTGVSPPKKVVVNEPLAKWNRQLPERCAEVVLTLAQLRAGRIRCDRWRHLPVVLRTGNAAELLGKIRKAGPALGVGYDRADNFSDARRTL